MVIKLSAFRPKAAAVCEKFDVHVALLVMLVMMVLTPRFRTALEYSARADVYVVEAPLR
jgi:hypothetical protein